MASLCVCVCVCVMSNKNLKLNGFLSQLIMLCVLEEHNIIIFPLGVTVLAVYCYSGLPPCILEWKRIIPYLITPAHYVWNIILTLSA